MVVNYFIKPMFIILLITTFITVPGCAKKNVPPVDFSLSRAEPCTKSLDERSKCFTIIDSSSCENRTNIILKPAEEYIIKVPPGQYWYDSDRLNTPPTGDQNPNLLMKMMGFLKKTRRSNYFSLIAEIKEEGNIYDLGADPNRIIKAVTHNGGELVLYANDARGFYWNNNGKIVVEILRVK